MECSIDSVTTKTGFDYMNKSNLYQLETIFSSTYPVDCYILKGRLESEGIQCFVYDDQVVSISPFKSVAVGGVKLKVPYGEKEKAKRIQRNLENNSLTDEKGKYSVNEALDKAFEKQNMVLSFYEAALKNPDILEDTAKQKAILKSGVFSVDETTSISKDIREFIHFNNVKFKLDWRQFFYELFDFERSFFNYLRVRPNKFYINKDILVKFRNKSNIVRKQQADECPRCKSDNVKYGYAIDYKLDILYLILSLLIMAPFFPFRKKYHCFECGHNFR